jgi:heme oxygenase (biliverdin-IX-beta and delta-forming)
MAAFLIILVSISAIAAPSGVSTECKNHRIVEEFPQNFYSSDQHRQMLTEELKEATAEAHRASEKKMITALKKIHGLTDYVHMLNWLYGFYAPVEALICRYLHPGNFPDIEKRRRADYLLWDIRETGLATPPPDPCPDLPVIDTFHRALGALYVTEGSALGGQIIAGMISRELETEKSLSYFVGYGAETRRMWQAFKEFINRPFTAAQRLDILAAAEDTFITFKNWIDKHELQPQL